jgi:hypothetical protein
VQDVIWWALYKAEAVLLGSWLRKKALEEVGVLLWCAGGFTCV